MYSSGVDTGMRFVELQQVSDAEMMSILTTLGSAHKDFAHSISHMSCVELLLVVCYRYFLVQHVARPLAVVVGSATSRNSARRSHTHENHIARGQCVCVRMCLLQTYDDFSRMQSKDSGFTLGVWGWSCVRQTLHNRSQPSARGRYGRA